MRSKISHRLLRDRGVVVIEYALIIAVICVGLVLALQPTVLGGEINSVVGRLANCLSAVSCS